MMGLHGVVALCVLCASAYAAAQAKPIVRAEVTPGEVSVGESVELRVTVLVPTWFVRPPVYPNFELSNAITRLPPDSSNPLRERVGRESWSGIERRYRLYPLLGAAYRLSGKSIKVTYANPGAEPITVDVALPEVSFRGAVPAGAEALDPYLAGRSLALTLEVDGATDGLNAGDALVLEYTAQLEGLPAIFLPVLAPELDVEGVAVYAEEPQLSNGPRARRSERLTLVFQAGGEFTVPDRNLRYWNTDAGSVEDVTAPGFTVTVAGAPVADVDSEVESTRSGWHAALLLAALALAAFLLVRSWPRLFEGYKAAVQRRRQSEAHAFRELKKAVKAGSPHAFYRALLAWVSRLAPGLEVRLFAETFGDETLAGQVRALNACLYNGGAVSHSPDLHTLERGLATARTRYLHRENGTSRSVLPTLNP